MLYGVGSWVVDVHSTPVVQEHPLVLRWVVPLVGQTLLEPRRRAALKQHRGLVLKGVEGLVDLNLKRVGLPSLRPDNVQLVQWRCGRAASPLVTELTSEEIHL